MESTVNLQEPFMYHLWPLLVLIILLFALGAILFVLNYKKTEKKIVEKPVFDQPKPVLRLDKAAIKAKYVNYLIDLYNKVHAGQMDTKAAYQELSMLVRDFVKEVSGLDVTTSTLQEIRGKNIPVIEQLISEYYEPEFAFETDDDAKSAINNAKRIIEKWN